MINYKKFKKRFWWYMFFIAILLMLMINRNLSAQHYATSGLLLHANGDTTIVKIPTKIGATDTLAFLWNTLPPIKEMKIDTTMVYTDWYKEYFITPFITFAAVVFAYIVIDEYYDHRAIEQFKEWIKNE